MKHFYNNIGENWFDFQDIYSRMVDNSTDDSHFVEVGSWKGRSAAHLAVEIFNSDKRIKFDCVDTWNGSVEHLDPNHWSYHEELVSNKDWLYYQFIKNTRRAGDVINPIRTTSLEASSLYPNRSLDFVFLDASHEYKDVITDLHAWYPKIKKGGYLGGHDYGNLEPVHAGVKLAVDEFFGDIPFEKIGTSFLHKKI